MMSCVALFLCCPCAFSAPQPENGSVAMLNTDVFPYSLNVDGQTTLPHIFFFNTDKGDFTYLRPQVEMAARAGVHIYSFPLYVPMVPGTDELNFGHAEQLLERFIVVDPQAKFLVRLVLGPTSLWKGFREKSEANAGEYFRYADGTTSGFVSFASDAFLEPTSRQLREIVRHFEGKYPERMLVYHVAPALSEFFDIGYREKGADYSPANTIAFREYLKERYRDVGRLRKAWGDEAITFESARVPMPAEGRFPMRLVLDRRIRAFYEPIEERAWVDYSQFYSELMSDHLIRWCKIVKEETGGNKMTAAFYGYLFTLPGSFCGHLDLEKVLKSEHVDVLCSPVSYHDRGSGGAGSFMSPVDSVVLNRKLWINEDDTRTHVIDVERHGGPPGFGVTASLDETLGVIDRNIANILTHGSGIWWMDLGASGMFNSQDVWDLIDRRQDLFRESEDAGKSTSADVHLIVDEESKTYFADDYGFDRSVLHNVLSALNRSSATVESYLLSDYVSGRTPRAELVVFANTFKMSQRQMRAVRARLARDKSHRVWCFLPGFIDGKGSYDTATVEKLTGFTISLQPGRVATEGAYGAFEGLTWNDGGNDLDLEERPMVSDRECTVIGRYISDNLPSCAMRSSDGVYSFYLGSPGASPELCRSILETAGVHVWADQPALVKKTNRYLFVYTGRAGELTLNVPDGMVLKGLDGETVSTTANRASLTTDETGARWFECAE